MHWLRSLPFMVLLCAAGCQSMAPVKLPEHLLLPCPEPTMRRTTNGELADTLDKFKWALRACNDDKAALREWQKEE